MDVSFYREGRTYFVNMKEKTFIIFPNKEGYLTIANCAINVSLNDLTFVSTFNAKDELYINGKKVILEGYIIRFEDGSQLKEEMLHLINDDRGAPK